MKYLSDQNRTCFFYESGTYALLSGARQWIGLVQNHDVDSNMNVIPIRYQGSTDRNVDAFADGQQEWAGTITYFPQDWKMLGFAIGSITDLAGSHVMGETNTDDHAVPVSPGGYPGPLSTITIEDSKNLGFPEGSAFTRVLIGGMIDSYQINFAQGEIVSAEMGYIAQAGSMNTSGVTALAATTEKPFMFSDVSLQIGSSTTMGKGTVDNLKEGTFSLNNNLERGFYLTGSRVAKELLPMNRDYEVTATCDMDTSNIGSLYDKYYIAGSEFNSTLNIFSAATNLGSLIVVMSGCKMTDMTVPSVLEGVQEQSFTFVPSHIEGMAMDAIGSYNYN